MQILTRFSSEKPKLPGSDYKNVGMYTLVSSSSAEPHNGVSLGAKPDRAYRSVLNSVKGGLHPEKHYGACVGKDGKPRMPTKGRQSKKVD